jgi:hypothetical protein
MTLAAGETGTFFDPGIRQRGDSLAFGCSHTFLGRNHGQQKMQ